MKKQILSVLLLCIATLAIAGDNNCAIVHKLINETNKKMLQGEASGAKFKTADDFDAWTAGTALNGATKSYVQEVNNSKMYVAEFGKADGNNSADPALSAKLEQLANMFKNCLGAGFLIRNINGSEDIFKGYQYDGTGENLHTKITLMLVYNPAEKKQLLFVSLVNDHK